MVRFVSGDIGGTNSRLQLTNVDDEGQEELVGEEIYPSQQYASLTFVIQKFLDKYNGGKENWPSACCLAVAGPVQGNKSKITNVGWTLDGEEMSRELGIARVQIINDFEGVGYGLLALGKDDVYALNNAPIVEGAPKACIGAGTGLGEAFLTFNGTEYDVWACEGGHADFAPRNQEEFKLMQSIQQAESVPRISVERIVSGQGIPRIYDYFASEYPAEVNPEITERFKTEDKGKVISEYAKSGSGLCKRTLETFVSAYGAEAGNLALKTLCRGGLYVAGGIAAKILFAIIENHNFYTHFVAKGRMESVLSQIPVFIVLNSQVGMLGAKLICRRILRKQGFHPKGQSPFYAENVPKAGYEDVLLDPDIQCAIINVKTAKARALKQDLHELDVTPRLFSPQSQSRSGDEGLSAVSPKSAPPLVDRAPSSSRSSIASLSAPASVAFDEKKLSRTLMKSALVGGLVVSLLTTSVSVLRDGNTMMSAFICVLLSLVIAYVQHDLKTSL